MLEESASKKIRGLEGVTRVVIRQDVAEEVPVVAVEVVADLLLRQAAMTSFANYVPLLESCGSRTGQRN